MNPAPLSLADLTGMLIGFTLTVFVLSYVIGDNVLFRLATYIFVGVAAGYVTVVTVYNVLWPQLLLPFLEGDKGGMTLAALYLLPSALLLTKLSTRLNRLGNPAMAILVGIGAAAAIGGAIFGTIFPQTGAAAASFEGYNLLNGLILLIGTLSTLLFFQFGQRLTTQPASLRAQMRRVIRWTGKLFIAVTFGAVFAGVYITALTALIERFAYLWQFIKNILLPTSG